MVREASQVPRPDNLISPISATAAPLPDIAGTPSSQQLKGDRLATDRAPHSLRAHASFLNRANVSLPGRLTLG